jgi:glycosyltransferase involved in cell wall biosynthesis
MAAGPAARRRHRRRIVALVGASASRTAYALVNARWRQWLGRQPGIEVRDAARAIAPSPPPDYIIHHDYSERFGEVARPPGGKLIAVRTWDFGPFPPTWVEKIRGQYDQLWVHSRWVRSQAIASGVDPRRVRVVPHGVDERLFRPTGRVARLPTPKRFRFIFVGATIVRKGVDVLLAAYRTAFRPEDDVCLVIKDHTGDVFYSGLSLRAEIQRLAADPRMPAILYIDDYLPAPDLAALYRACDVAVFPYRAEGFCLPVLEAMACGVPPIVPRFGPALDYCSSRTAFRIPARRIRLPMRGRFAFNTLGFTEDLEGVDFCEVEVGVLAESLRAAYGCPPERLARMARAGVRVVRSRFRWRDAAVRIARYLGALDRDGAGRVRPRPAPGERARRRAAGSRDRGHAVGG